MKNAEIQKLLKDKQNLYFARIERDESEQWETGVSTPVILTDDFHLAVGLVKGYIGDLVENISGDSSIYYLEDFLKTAGIFIGKGEYKLSFIEPFKPYRGVVRLDPEKEELVIIFEQNAKRLYIVVEKIDFKNVYLLFNN